MRRPHDTEPAAITASKDALKARLKALVRAQMGATGDWHPLSPGQESLWFLWQMAPESSAFSMAFPMRIKGALDREALERAFAALVARHACLRSEFSEAGGKVQQRGRSDHQIRIEHRESASWDEEALQQDLEKFARQPFDLRQDASLRARLWMRGENEHVLCLVLHHIVGDLWSLVVLMDELRALYGAMRKGSTAPSAALSKLPELPELPVTYADYVRAMHLAQKRSVYQPALDYWAGELPSDLPSLDLPSLDLPTDSPRPARQRFKGSTVFHTLEASLADEVEAFARAHDTTVFVVLLAAYQTLLHRFSGQAQLLVGTPFSGRHLPGTESIIGDFINMLPLRADFDETPTFATHVAALRDRLLQAMKHQAVPFAQIVDRLAPARDLSRPPIFQTTFVLQKFHRYEVLQNAFLPGKGEAPVPFADLELSGLALSQQAGQFDLNLEMKRDSHGRLQAAWKYDTALFTAATVENMASCFRVLLQALIRSPDMQVARVPLLNSAESAAVILAAEGPHRAAPPQKSLAALFEDWAQKTPQAPAIACKSQQHSYASLRDRMQQLARALSARGIARETMVALVLPRGCDLAVAMLGVARAGGAFLPLAPDTPPERLKQVIALSQSYLVLTSQTGEAEIRAVLDALPAAATAADAPQVVSLETLLAEEHHSDLPALPQDHDLAYMIFTSGSTGTPKGQ